MRIKQKVNRLFRTAFGMIFNILFICFTILFSLSTTVDATLSDWTIGSEGTTWIDNTAFDNTTLINENAVLQNGYNPLQPFWITSGGQVGGSLQSEDYKETQRFTAQQNKKIIKVGVYWKPEYSTSWTPTPNYKVGIQSDSGGLPDGTWLGYGVVKPGEDSSAQSNGDWAFVPLNSPVDLVKGNKYHIVTEWDSGLIDNAHYSMLFINTPTIDTIPFNSRDPDGNRATVDSDMALLTYSNSNGWVTHKGTIVFLLNFNDDTYYGQPYAHGYQALQDKTKAYYRETIKIDFQNKTIETIGSTVGIRLDFQPAGTDDEKWARLKDVNYEIYEGTTLLRSGILAYQSEIKDHYYNPGNADKRFFWYEKPLSNPLTLQKDHIYRINIFSPGTIDGAYTVDAAEVRTWINPAYLYTGPDPFAITTWGGIDSYLERWDDVNKIWKDDGKRRDVSLKFKLVDVYSGTITSITKDAESIGLPGDVWKQIKFVGSIPYGTIVNIAINSSKCNGFVTVQNNTFSGTIYDLPPCAQQRYANWRLILKTNNPSFSPEIHNVVLYTSNNTPSNPAPTIISFSPSNLTPRIAQNTTTSFSVTTDQQVSSTWYLDGANQNNNVQAWSHTWDTPGQHNVTYMGTNSNGSVSMTWSVSVIPDSPFDVNRDTYVNQTDLNIIGQHFNENPPTYARADVNANGIADVYDVILVSSNIN